MPSAVPPKNRAAMSPDYISPDGAEIRLVLRPEVEGVRFHSLCEAVFRHGQVSRALRHRTVEESWYVLEGVAEVWRLPPGAPPAEGAVLRLGAGEALNIPQGFSFQVRSAGPGRLRMLCSTAPPWPGPDEAIPVDGGLGDPTD
jgi:mannose-6-phosphate isomerase-like protein (cupin superfamily)